ncbi:MXAN_6577-like cysteine-rich protein [Sorangium sp. So ce131]|uniref:MXAN_6577-like cysteine-rich protein n=1 Tax=Sorangium sp. So ce131 TaxID=3133282 RepID=UPI003F629952
MKRDGFRFTHALSSAVLWLPAAVLAPFACASTGDDPGQLCDPPYTSCDGVCVDLSSDDDSCGACDERCPAGEVCVDGRCEEETTDAAGGGGSGGDGGGDDGGEADGGGGEGGAPLDCDDGPYVRRCGDACVDVSTDPDNCGRCGVQCDPGRACAGALCQTTTCIEGFTRCGSDCVDVSANPEHCGRCGRTCDPGAACERGVCACNLEPSEDIGSAVPQRVNGTTVGAEDTRSLSCVRGTGGDQTFLFTAPHAGTYLFDTFVASYDTALAALSAVGCVELACNDDAGGNQSQISVDLAEGETILVVVSGNGGAEGDFTLHVSEYGPVMCAPTALEPVVPQTVEGTTLGMDDSVFSACDFESSGDTTYTFTAPESGLYVFKASSPDGMVLDVLNGNKCMDESLGCRWGYREVRTVAELEAEQTVLVAVAGAEAALDEFTLDIFMAPACPSQDLGSTVPQTVTGNNEELLDVISACLSSVSGGEATYRFTAPADGLYTFDASGSSFPAVLEVRRDSCTGEVLACADTSEGAAAARSTLSLLAGESVVLVVDSYGERGDFELAIYEQVCPAIDLGSTAPQTVTGTTEGAPDLLEPICSPFNGPEATYRFTAPADGLYVFDTAGSAIDTVLEVLDGTCAGTWLKCNDDVATDEDSTDSQVSLLLSEGQTVVVAVESDSSASGEYTLNITQLEAPPCPLFDLGSEVPQSVTGNNEGYADVLESGCASLPGGEATYSFTAPSDGYYLFDTVGSTIDTVLSVHQGGCGGPEVACSANGTDSSAFVELSAGETIVVSVDSNGPGGAYALNVSAFDGSGSCAAPMALESTVPQVVTGTTRGRVAAAESICGGSEAPEAVYSFTAPEEGYYTFDLGGSRYDTVIAVFDGDCTGVELDCNDDFIGLQSLVTVLLEAGQTVVVVVDGYGDNSGDYTLTIDN